MTDFPFGAANSLPRPGDDHARATEAAVRWLDERHRKGWRAACIALLNAWRPGSEDEPWPLGDDFAQMLSVNVNEWQLARGEIFARGATRVISEHLLGPDGPNLGPGQQRWIAQLRERPLRLYRVTEVRRDDGLTLVDALDPAADPVRVRERSATRSTQPGRLLAVRIMQLGDHFELSGAVYPFTQRHEPAVIAQVTSAVQSAGNVQEQVTAGELAIARAWVAQWFEPMPTPGTA